MFKTLLQLQSRLPPLPQVPMSQPVKVTAFTVSLGFALIGFFAMFFRRRRGRRDKRATKPCTKQRTGPYHYPRLSKLSSPNGDIPSRNRGSDISDIRSLIQQRSLSSSMTSLGAASSSTVTHPLVDTSNMSSLQLCQRGMESLSHAVSYWEDGIMKLTYLSDENDQPYLAIPDTDTAALQHRLEHLLDLAYRMQDNYEREYEKYGDQVALESALSAFAEMDFLQERRSLDDSSSDQESYVSAADMAHLADLESHKEMFKYFPLYEAGLLELKHSHVPFRSLRTDMAECLSDTDFLAKLFGVRLAFDSLFKDPEKRNWFSSMGRKLLADMLIQADKDPEEFYVAYDKCMDFVDNYDNWPKMEEELKGRGVKVMSFYDIVLDFMMMDAFDDLETPPRSVTAVVSNRWLSNGFKETALATAVWSVIKAKRRMLKFSDGFISHFYGITEHITPVLAWGFLGPESDVKQLCHFFRGLVIGFISDIFSFECSRFTTVEALAEDILKNAKVKSKIASERLSPHL